MIFIDDPKFSTDMLTMAIMELLTTLMGQDKVHMDSKELGLVRKLHLYLSCLSTVLSKMPKC